MSAAAEVSESPSMMERAERGEMGLGRAAMRAAAVSGSVTRDGEAEDRGDWTDASMEMSDM